MKGRVCSRPSNLHQNSPQPPECPEKRPRFRMAAEHRIDVGRQQASAERALAARDSSARAALVNGQAGTQYQALFSPVLYPNRNCLSFSSRLVSPTLLDLYTLRSQFLTAGGMFGVPARNRALFTTASSHTALTRPLAGYRGSFIRPVKGVGCSLLSSSSASLLYRIVCIQL